MHCLVTGVAGFVGSSLADKLLSNGHTVTGIDCFVDYYSKKIKSRNLSAALTKSNFRFIEGSIADLNLTDLLSDVDVIYHQAGQAGVRASWGGYFDTYTLHNIVATQKLLEAAKTVGQIKKIVFASSSSVYGDAESRPTREDALPKPVSPYGVTKLAAEHLVTLYASQFGLPTVSLRYFTVYGPRQRPDMAFHRFIKAAFKKEPIIVYGDGEQSRDFTYISDIVDANIAAAEHGGNGDVFNIGGGTQATVNDVLAILTSEIGSIIVNREDRQLGDARHTSADCTRARRILKFAPKVSLPEGIKKEIEWVKEEISVGTL